MHKHIFYTLETWLVSYSKMTVWHGAYSISIIVM